LKKTSDIGARAGRWAAVFVGLLVTVKAVGFLVTRVFRFTRNEVNARGSDVNFVLGLAERRSSAH
jgi:hypothetical protein